MNAVEDNRWSQAFRALGAQLPKPRAILAISAHWFVPGTFLTGVPSSVLMGVALFAALDGRQQLATPPEIMELAGLVHAAPGDTVKATRAVPATGTDVPHHEFESVRGSAVATARPAPIGRTKWKTAGAWTARGWRRPSLTAESASHAG